MNVEKTLYELIGEIGNINSILVGMETELQNLISEEKLRKLAENEI